MTASLATPTLHSVLRELVHAQLGVAPEHRPKEWHIDSVRYLNLLEELTEYRKAQGLPVLFCENGGLLLAGVPVYSKPDPRDPDYSRSGIFQTHNCWKCHDGAKPCMKGYTLDCEYPHARND